MVSIGFSHAGGALPLVATSTAVVFIASCLCLLVEVLGK